MSSVSHLSLANHLAKQNATTTNGSDSSSLPNLTEALAAVNGTNLGNGSSSATGNSYLLDLSPEAQAYLTSMNGNGSSSSQASTTSSTGAGIVLSPVQQDKLSAILQKYKDAPYTDATFKAIQRDMSAAGIGADSLAGKAAMRNLNPTSMLLNALAGGDGSVGTIGGSADIAAMEMNFMGTVNTQWQRMSSDYDPSTGKSKTVSSDGGAAGGSSGTDA